MVSNAVNKELPPLFKRHVRRPRLTRILDATRARVVLLVAPAGFGKTTLVAEWLQGRNAGLWYAATSASADVAAFAADLVDVLQPAFPGAGSRALQRMRVPAAPERMPRTLAELLAEDLQDWPTDKWLVIDDYHLVAESAAVEEFVDSLLTLAPVRLVVTSRTRPSWASARRVLYGEFLDLTRDQLALSDREAHQVLRALSRKQATTIVEQAKGWPALVGLASLVGESEVPEGNVAATLYRYFAEEVLRRSPQDTQLALLKLSALPKFTAEYFSALDIPLERIRSLLRDQPLVPVAEAGSSRLHPLLREFLLQRFVEEQPSEFRAVHNRLIKVARKAGDWPEAFALAMQVGNLNAAADVARDAGPPLLAAGRHETLDKWLSACSEVIADRPDALLLHAEALLRRGKLTDAYGIASRVSVANYESSVVSRAWRLRGRASYWLGENERALSEQQKAIELAADASEVQEALWGSFLAAQQLDLPEADSFLDQLEDAISLDPAMRLRLAVGRSVGGARRGTFEGAHDRMEASAGFLDRTTDPEVKSSFLAHWAYVEVNRSRYEHAYALAEEASDYARLLRLGLPMHASLTCKALAEIGLRRFRQAARTLLEMRRVEAERPDPTLPLQTLIVETKLSLSDKSGHRRTPRAEPDRFDPSLGEFNALQALAAAVRGELVTAEQLAKEALSKSTTAECTLYGRFAMVIVGLESRPRGATVHELHEAVRDAFARECHDAYVLAYRAAPSLLTYAAESPALRAMTRQVIALAHDHSLAATFGLPTPTLEPLHHTLTKRELEIFGLITRGLTNREIAEQLVLSTSTVKVHVRNVLKKLGVRTRREAMIHFGSFED